MKKVKTLAAFLLVLQLSPTTVLAQDDLLGDSEDIFNSEQIDVDGTFRRKQTAAEKIAKMRKKLEQQNEQMVQKKIENIRIKQEQELANKLRSAFNGNMQALDGQDQVGTVQSAPQKVIAPAPLVEEPVQQEKKNKVIPFMGLRQFDGENIDSFESKAHFGLTLENKISQRFAVAVGVQYTTMEIQDSKTINHYYNYTFNINTDEDEIGYKSLNLNINGKFYLTKASKIKPYLGAGLGYNRTSLKFNKRTQNPYNPTFGSIYNVNQQEDDAQVSANYLNGQALVGAEVSFTDTVGMNLEFNYAKALTSGFEKDFNNSNYVSQTDRDERILSNIGSDIVESDSASITAGLVVSF